MINFIILSLIVSFLGNVNLVDETIKLEDSENIEVIEDITKSGCKKIYLKQEYLYFLQKPKEQIPDALEYNYDMISQAVTYLYTNKDLEGKNIFYNNCFEIYDGKQKILKINKTELKNEPLMIGYIKNNFIKKMTSDFIKNEKISFKKIMDAQWEICPEYCEGYLYDEKPNYDSFKKTVLNRKNILIINEKIFSILKNRKKSFLGNEYFKNKIKEISNVYFDNENCLRITAFDYDIYSDNSEITKDNFIRCDINNFFIFNNLLFLDYKDSYSYYESFIINPIEIEKSKKREHLFSKEYLKKIYPIYDSNEIIYLFIKNSGGHGNNSTWFDIYDVKNDNYYDFIRLDKYKDAEMYLIDNTKIIMKLEYISGKEIEIGDLILSADKTKVEDKYILIDFKKIDFIRTDIIDAFKNGKLIDIEKVNGVESEKIKYYFDENESTDALILFKDTEKEKIVFKQDDKKIIEITNKNTFNIINNIKIGDSVEKVIQENGNDFYFYGFEWDDGGLVTNWNNGKFSGGKFSIYFKIKGEYNENIINNLLGSKELYTKDIDFEKVDIVVDKILFVVN